nr:c-type cytochrome [Cupriavidus sp. AU9028]
MLAAIAFGVGIWLGERKAERRVDVDAAPVSWRTDAEALARGKYLYDSRGCMECHGADGRGKVVLRDGKGLYVRSPNITAGNPQVAEYEPVDWVLAIRHGVSPTGRPLLIMPSEDYNQLSDDDLSALVGYIRSLPALPGGSGEVQLPSLVWAMYGYGMIRDAAAKIDHTLPPPAPQPPAATASYGAYVANSCIGCHGANLAGGKIPGAPPDWPPAADLRPGAAMSRYDTAERFVSMMRSGRRPDGSEVSRVMPFDTLSRMSDTDLTALWLHLRELPLTQASR